MYETDRGRVGRSVEVGGMENDGEIKGGLGGRREKGRRGCSPPIPSLPFPVS